MRCEHGGEVDGGHLVDLLVTRGVVEQVEQQLQQAAVGRRQQHQQQLERLDLPLLVRDAGLVALIVEAGQRCVRGSERMTARCLGATSESQKRRSPRQYLQSSGGRDSVGV